MPPALYMSFASPVASTGRIWVKVNDGHYGNTRQQLGIQSEGLHGLGLHVASWTGAYLFSAWLPRNASSAAGAQNAVGKDSDCDGSQPLAGQVSSLQLLLVCDTSQIAACPSCLQHDYHVETWLQCMRHSCKGMHCCYDLT